MGRPAKSLLEFVLDGTFRARRHGELLAGPDLPWPWAVVLQRQYQAARSEPERRAVALAFEHAVNEIHKQTALAQGAAGGEGLAAELAELGPAGNAQQLLEFFPAYLRHPMGRLIGQPFVLEGWQRRFLRELYRRDRKGRRVYRVGLLGLPRGSGKTALAAGLALYELVSRPDAPDIYFAAPSKGQAEIGLAFARGFVEGGPLAAWVKGNKTLTCPATHGSLRVISSAGALQHGLAPAVAIVDELWAFDTRSQVEAYTALNTALHKRDDSYLLAITTAGFDRGSLLGRIFESAFDWPDLKTERNGCLTIARDPENGLLMWWYGAPAGADIDDPKIRRACNPASFVNLRELDQQRHDPSLSELDFRRLRLNQWVKAGKAWLPDGCWESLTSNDTIPEGAKVYVGVDIGISQDTTAVAWAYRQDNGVIIVRARVWAAQEKAAAHIHVDDGKVRLEEIEEFILERLAKEMRVEEIAYDPHFFHRSAEIIALRNLATIEFLSASDPFYTATQRFYQLACQGQLTHNGDDILAAHIAATAARPTERGWKLSKLRSRLHIDATVAAVMAVARADIHAAPQPVPTIHWIDVGRL